MKGYWLILGGDIVDQEAQAEYGRLWGPIAEKYGARIKVMGAEALVEAHHSKRVLLVEFASLEQARACYADPLYSQAMVYANKGSRRELLIMEAELP